MIGNNSKLTRKKTLMFDGLRLCVPFVWVLIISLTFAIASSSSDSVSQLWLAVPTFDILIENIEVHRDISEYTGDQGTSEEVSCVDEKMVHLSSVQKQVIKLLYRNGEKVVKTESHIEFLSKSIQNKR